MMKKIFIILILNLPFVVNCQHNLKGVVLDSINHQPVPFATVFINGSSKGTYTDTAGAFIIKNVILPSQVVVSRIGYETRMTYIETIDQNNLKICLNGLLLKEIVVLDDNKRKENLTIFKQWYIGTDLWGQNAIIRNDSSIIFNHDYNYRKVNIRNRSKKNISKELSRNVVEWGKDSLYVIIKEVASLKAKSNSPLKIDLPLLGYTLHVDLIDFTYRYRGDLCSALGYYYWEPYSDNSEQETKLYEKNRQRVYYGSSQHFCRSLYDNMLEKNGFRLYEQTKIVVSQSKTLRFVNIDTCIKHINGNEMQFLGLKDKHIIIHYFSNSSGEPIDLTLNKGVNYKQSEIYFLNDTCLVRSDGTIFDNNIMFGGEISKKKAGALLPNDYVISGIE